METLEVITNVIMIVIYVKVKATADGRLTKLVVELRGKVTNKVSKLGVKMCLRSS